MPLRPESRIIRRDGIPEAKLSEDNIVLLNAQRGNYYSLDYTGLRIWELLEEETTIIAVCEQLSKEYDISVTDCIADTISFCQRLHTENLIICLDETTS